MHWRCLLFLIIKYIDFLIFYIGVITIRAPAYCLYCSYHFHIPSDHELRLPEKSYITKRPNSKENTNRKFPYQMLKSKAQKRMEYNCHLSVVKHILHVHLRLADFTLAIRMACLSYSNTIQ